jgi:1-acyl-sn-glycerol-3-phosphate acyltransferase
MARASATPPPEEPLVVYASHTSWWDPLIMLLVNDALMTGRASFAPIDAEALERYRFFKHLGFFPVRKNDPRSAAQFLGTAVELLREPNHALWITPQGRFADPRERPLGFTRGLGHVAVRAPHAWFVPLAVEYPFWEERKPEILIRLGTPLRPADHPQVGDAMAWSQRLEDTLTATMDALEADSIRREAGAFSRLLAGQAGVGGVYDLWRRARALLRGSPPNLHHGTL